MNMSLQFEFPLSLTAEQFIAELSRQTDTQLASTQSYSKTYYDSFDWRLYSNDVCCEFTVLLRSRQAVDGANKQAISKVERQADSALTLRSLNSGLMVAGSALKKVPSFGKAFEPGIIRDKLTPLLEMRALLPVCRLDYQLYRLNIVNEDQNDVRGCAIRSLPIAAPSKHQHQEHERRNQFHGGAFWCEVTTKQLVCSESLQENLRSQRQTSLLDSLRNN